MKKQQQKLIKQHKGVVFQNSTQKIQTVIDITPRTANPKESEDDVK